MINNGNWTNWGECNLGWNHMRDFQIEWVRFEITSMISDQNYTTRGSITTLSHLFWNHPNTGLGHFKHFIDAVLSRTEIKFIHFFFWGGGGVRVLETEFATWYSVCHFSAIWSVTLNKPWNLIGCFIFIVASSLPGKKMRFKAKNWCDSWINHTN